MTTYSRLTPKTALYLAAPHTWPASVLPALFAELYCIASGIPLNFFIAVAMLLICVLMQSGTNTINDYYDFIKGTDTAHDNVEENDSVLVYHNVDPKHALMLGLGFMALAALLGLAVVCFSGILPLIIGAIGGFAAIFYSFGPLPISYLPIGELVSGFVMGGLIPLGITSAASGEIIWEVLLYSLPAILGIALIMMTNNGSDIEKDEVAKRHTLPVLLGRKRSCIVYHGITIVWVLAICVLPFIKLGIAGIASPVALLIFARKPFAALIKTELLPEKRVMQMKAVLGANIFGNSSYILSYLVAIIISLIAR